MAAQFATPDKVAFFLEHTSGLICVPLVPERLDQLNLPLMVANNTESQRTAFTVTVDYIHGTTTGISAEDRAATIRALIHPATQPTDLARPGHVLPLRYREGGSLKRAGHTEATIDLCRLAKCIPAGVLCELVSEDKRSMARLAELERFAEKHGLCLVTIADLIEYRRRSEKLVERVSSARIPTDAYGEFTGYVFRSLLDGEEHFALVAGDVTDGQPVLTRVHSECLTGDVFGSARCDCGPQLDFALRRIAEEGRGVLVYLRGHEGRGIGLGHKIRAYYAPRAAAATPSTPTWSSACRSTRASMASARRSWPTSGCSTIRLMTNNPAKYGGIEGFGLDTVERVPIQTTPTEENISYLRTKRERLGHLLEGLDGGD